MDVKALPWVFRNRLSQVSKSIPDLCAHSPTCPLSRPTALPEPLKLFGAFILRGRTTGRILAGKKRLLGKFVKTQLHERRKFKEHLRKNKTHTQTKQKKNHLMEAWLSEHHSSPTIARWWWRWLMMTTRPADVALPPPYFLQMVHASADNTRWRCPACFFQFPLLLFFFSVLVCGKSIKHVWRILTHM